MRRWLSPKKGRELLSTLALLSEPVDYVTLSALNPFLPPVPEEPILPSGSEVGCFMEVKDYGADGFVTQKI